MSLKLVELAPVEGGYQVQAFTDAPIPKEVVSGDMIKNQGLLVKTIKDALAHPKFGKITTPYVVASIPETKSFVRVIQMPAMSEDEAAEAIRWEAESYIPLPICQVYLDWMILPHAQTKTTDPEKMTVLITASPKDYIDDFTKIQPEDSNPAAGSKTNFFEKLYFGKVDRTHSFEVLLKFLKTLGETRLLSNPKLAVINNQEARIHIGRKEAYVTTTTTTGQTTTTTAEDVTFVDVGIQLSVTPTINDDGYISLQIKPEISSVVDVLTTPSGNEIPIIDTSLAETTVLVKDSSTIIIGGLRREEETENSEGLPIFSQIPVLGNLFTSKKKTRERSELLVMITPRIVSGDILTNTGDIEMAQPNTKSYREYNSFDVAEPEPAELRLKPYRD